MHMPTDAADAMSPRHPLTDDPEICARIEQVMKGAVQRRLGRDFGRRDREPVLAGGASIDDIVQEAMSKLWAKDPDDVDDYSALAVTIADRCAIDQLRRSTAGRTYGDAEGKRAVRPVDYLSQPTKASRQDEDGPTIGETLEIDDPAADPHHQYVIIRQEIVLAELAEALPQRDRDIFFAVHFEDRTRESVATDIGLSAARVGQIYTKRLRELFARVRAMPEFEAEYNDPEGDEVP